MGQVDAAANRLARWLVGRGVGAGDVVAALVMLRAAAQAVIASCGAVEDGMRLAYLPLMRLIRAARVKFMLDDAKPVVAVCTAGFGQRLDGLGVQVIEVDDPAIATQPADPLPSRRRPTSPTSSTPRAHHRHPKAVAITHHNITELFALCTRSAASARAGVGAVSFAMPLMCRCGDVECAAPRRTPLVIVPTEVTRSPTELLGLPG
ncbi:hypothetical protein MKANGN_11630 [Mycobacterium kansasii]|uniref:AMP-binding protein n=1 Tax=Mycobacterium kansasii TaxID=1768 RepID=UPI001910B7F5|nr:AMP-binding protein [Mycobacterium kansasii]GFP47285.1 hypothetical protein MKANGN_11630 [Mycobacterium kansasii]